MGVGVRTSDLRKTYHSPPPMAAGTAGFLTSSGTKPGRQQKKQKSEIKALEGVSLDIQAGEVFGLLGPNGAGKSTTVGILTTRIRPTGGRAWIGEYDVWRQQVEAKRLIGVVQQRPNLDFALTAREILLFHGGFFGLSHDERHRRAAALLDRFHLTERADELVRNYSGGMMQRISIARAMMHDPQVLFLDEPSTGLDPQTRLLVWEIIREYNQAGKTILLTTHNMEEADALCSHLAVIDHGRVIAEGRPAELKRMIPGGYLLRLRFSGEPDGLAERLRQIPGVTEVRMDGAAADLYADHGGSLIGHIVRATGDSGVELCDVHISEPSIENLFLHLTGRSLRQ